MSLFLQDQLLPFQHRDLRFERGNHGGLAHVEDALDQACDLPLDLDQSGPCGLRGKLRKLALLRPRIREHGAQHFKHGFGWADLFKRILERTFNVRAPDGLSGAGTAFVEARVIRMALACLALRPVGRERMLAVATQNEAAQGEVRIEVGTRWDGSTALQALLHPLEGLQVHEAFMAALAQCAG